MNNTEKIKELINFLPETKPEDYDIIKAQLLGIITDRETASNAVSVLMETLLASQEGQALSDSGFYKNVTDAKLVIMIIEIFHKCLNMGADISLLITLIARLLYIDRRESEKTSDELYLQYRIAAILDEAVRLEIHLSKEAIDLILIGRYFSDIPTREYLCNLYWRLAEQGVDISCKIRTLICEFHNNESFNLSDNSITALWAAVSGGFFDSKIIGSKENLTYHVWLWHLVTDCVWKLKPKYDSRLRLGIAGCLLETAGRYPETRLLILECLEIWGIREPKRLTTELHHDLAELFSRCRDNPGTTCLPNNTRIVKKGINHYAGAD